MIYNYNTICAYMYLWHTVVRLVRTTYMENQCATVDTRDTGIILVVLTYSNLYHIAVVTGVSIGCRSISMAIHARTPRYLLGPNSVLSQLSVMSSDPGVPKHLSAFPDKKLE